jgi:FtsZ-binding cell division protein ZapB
MLAAKGIGIARILLLALELAERKRYNNKIKQEIHIVSRRMEVKRRESVASGLS